MEPSEEIRRVIDRWLVANTGGDADAVLGKVSEHTGVLAIGTDAEECGAARRPTPSGGVSSRSWSQALGGEVLVSNLVRELVAGGGPGIDFLESRDVDLKGLDGSHRLFAVDLT